MTTASAQETKAAILQAAERIFIEKGPEGASMREIAGASAVNKSLIHHHFGSKDGLWTAVKTGLYGDFKATMERIFDRAEPSLEMFREAMEALFGFFGRHPEFVRLHGWINIEGDTSCAQMAQSLFALGTARMYEAQARGLIRPAVDPRHVFLVIWSLSVHWFQARQQFARLLGREHSAEALDAEHLEQVLSIVLDGVTPHPTH